MKLPPIAVLLAALTASSCASTAAEENHWRLTSVAPRVGYHFFGYTPQMDGSYMHRLGMDASDFGATLQRHFWLGDPDNPRLPHATVRPPKPQPPNVEFRVSAK